MVSLSLIIKLILKIFYWLILPIVGFALLVAFLGMGCLSVFYGIREILWRNYQGFLLISLGILAFVFSYGIASYLTRFFAGILSSNH